MRISDWSSDVCSSDLITLLRDADGNGIAETRTVFLSGLHQPFGMLLLGDTFYVAATAAVWQFAYHRGDTRLAGDGRKILSLPAGPHNGQDRKRTRLNSRH